MSCCEEQTHISASSADSAYSAYSIIALPFHDEGMVSVLISYWMRHNKELPIRLYLTDSNFMSIDNILYKIKYHIM